MARHIVYFEDWVEWLLFLDNDEVLMHNADSSVSSGQIVVVDAEAVVSNLI